MRILVITAHPDDIEFGMGGTVASWTDEGHEVSFCIVTDGSTGTQDTEMVGERLAALRRTETLDAAADMGVTDVTFLGYPDGYVEPTLELRRDIARVFRTKRPHRLVTMEVDPVIDGWFVNHPDHRAVGQAALDVSLTAGTTPGHFPELLDEGLPVWRGVMEIWLAGPGDTETAVDISRFVDAKVSALMRHQSQVSGWEGLADQVREWSAQAGRKHGLEAAETFHVIHPLGAPTTEL